jgi:hypothetical protein
MSKFIYKVSETSKDTRNYKIESDRHLSYDEIVEFVSDCGSDSYEPQSYELNAIKVKYIDTDWGEDTDYGIESDCNCDPINEYLCFDHEREAIKEKYPNAVYTDQCTWEVDGKEVEL